MTQADRAAPAAEARQATQASSPFGDAAGDAYIRRAGRGLIISLYAALRAIRLYPLENAAVQNAADDLTGVAASLIQREQELEIRVSGEFVFVVKPDRTVESRPVTIGVRSDQALVVDRGLEFGETIVIEGQLRLAPGSRVAVRAGNRARPAKGGTPES